MEALNYHHLRQFWAVAKEGGVSRAAARMHVAQSSLSTQVRQLEQRLGQALFVRTARTMRLTEAGRVALNYAESIFAAGDEMVAVMNGRLRSRQQTLRIGAVATLSRNFVDNFLRPLLGVDDVQLSLTSGTLRELLDQLRVHSLDLVLANQRVVATSEDPWRCRRIARQPVSLVGHAGARRRPFRFPKGLDGAALVLPSQETEFRAAFDVMCRRLGVRYVLRAQADDMALLRLLARDSDSIALLPTVVVQDELRSGQLVELCEIPHLYESFYAITAPRRFMPSALRALLSRPEDAALARR
jgi:LysR family transcriptional activator of nhaA